MGNVGHRRVAVARLPALMGEMLPTRFRLAPVKRRGDALALHPAPAVRQPQARIGIAAIGDEFLPLAIGHQPVSQREGFQ